jgi:hypothetical protein
MPAGYRYNPGDYYQIDDISGFKIRASYSRKQWDNLVTAHGRFSPRNPQDFVMGVRDDQTVSMPRPRQANQYAVVATYVTAPTPAGVFSLPVASVAGFNVGDQCQVMLDIGTQFVFTLASIVGQTLNWTGTPLPGSVCVLYGLTDNQVLDLTSAAAA